MLRQKSVGAEQKMRVAVLFSGGKDSLYTVQKLREVGHDVKLLLTLKPGSAESLLFHYPCVEWTSLQAEAMGIPISAFNVEAGREEDELRECIAEIRIQHGVDGVAAGAVASQYQKRRIEDMADRLGLRCLTPLWGMDQMRLLREEVESGLEAVVVAVAALGLDQRWLGRTLDRDAIEELGRLRDRYGLNPSGEGGEYETFVVDSNMFKKRIVVSDLLRVWRGDRGHLELVKAELVEKG
ncbi:diphthine--ammonia ligase [Candidatus Bathyarchaeota archaeon]|nr:diphthine--ammonia ligase [Candidatus Bathyarchaeota archaeon]